MRKKLQIVILLILSVTLICLLLLAFLNKRMVKVTFDTDRGTPIESIVLRKGRVLELKKETTKEV